MTFALTSCGDDDDKPEEGNIVGTWENVSEIDAELGLKQYVKFQEDGKYFEVNIYDYDGEVDVLKGTWSKDGNKIRVSGSDIISGTATITELTNSSMTLSMMGIPQEYKRVSDTAIDKYL